VQYGKIINVPVKEDHPLNPVDNNGISKHAYEQYCLLYHRTYGVRTSSLRLSNIYGPRNIMKHARQGFVNWFVRLAIEGRSIEIFGDGSQIREYTYVDDVVEACIQCATKAGTDGSAYNVGGFPSSVLAVAEALRELRPDTEIVFKPFPKERKSIEIGDYISDYTRFTEDTGWKPTVQLREGLRRTVEFYETEKRHYW
jgi:nucleoside-diphosphate-sugar epimerase